MVCIFCKIASGEIPAKTVLEDDEIMAFLDIKPVRPGHLVVIPKRHSDSLATIDPVDLQALFDRCQQLVRAYERIGIHGVRVVSNVGPDSGREVEHTHVHLIPRTKGDGVDWWPQHPYEPGVDVEWQRKLHDALR